jgi:L,D-peptidoglycan transpeptidase YkuD (ErfK/YbiS/YcfS/YnhG family)
VTYEPDPRERPLSRRSLLALGGAAALSVAASGPGGPGATVTPGTAVINPRPLDLKGLGSSRQVVIVTTSGWSTIHGTIEAWQLGSDNVWRRVMAPYNANIGINGWVDGTRRVQGDHRTPTGIYRLRQAFGRSPDPGSGLGYHRLTTANYWAGDQRDPKTYNIFQFSHPATAIWRTSQSEHLYDIQPAYQYVLPIDWNLAGGVHRASDGQYVATTPANVRLGSAIFLHCYGTTGPHGYTLGCVNTHPAKIAELMRWLDPAALPMIAMGPPSAILA